MRAASIVVIAIALFTACGGNVETATTTLAGTGGEPSFDGGAGLDAAAGAAAGGQSGGAAGAGGTSGAPGGGGMPFDASIDAPSSQCEDGVKNGGESDVDCGGPSCPTCAGGMQCKLDTDCQSSVCQSTGVCCAATVFGVQTGSESLGCSLNANHTIQPGVTLNPVVVVSPRYSVSDALDGYYVQDPIGTWPPGTMGEYTGMLLVVDKGSTDFSPGDLVSARGDYAEFFCLTELRASKVEKIGSAAVPPPMIVTPSSFAGGGGMQTEAYEGLVVTLQDVAITSTQGGSQPSWWFMAGDGILVTNDFDVAPFVPEPGMSLQRLTGGVRVAYGKYLISPRHVDDIETGP